MKYPTMSAVFAGLGQLYMSQLAQLEAVTHPHLALQWRLLVCDAMDKASAARCAERERGEL